jgi:hypothetical protein
MSSMTGRGGSRCVTWRREGRRDGQGMRGSTTRVQVKWTVLEQKYHRTRNEEVKRSRNDRQEVKGNSKNTGKQQEHRKTVIARKQSETLGITRRLISNYGRNL